MKTVSTLCATGTLGAAGLGVTFATSDSPRTTGSPDTTKRHLSHHDAGTSHMTLDASLLSSPDVGSSRGSPIPSSPAASDLSGLAPRQSLGSKSTGRYRRITSDGNPLNFFRFSGTSPSPAAGTLQAESSSRQQSGRPKSRRFSSFSFSQSTSPSSSIGPTSTSATQSSGSSVPFIRSATPTQLPPNKLVKRSLSQHASGSSSAGSRRISLRGPATSHQRSATLSRQSTDLRTGRYDRRYAEPLEADPTHEETTYRHYFEARTPQHDVSVGTNQRRSSADPSYIKRIYPDSKRHPPILVSPHAIAAVDVAFDEATKRESTNFNFGPQPATLPGVPHIFSATSPTVGPFKVLEPRSENRRSFSLSDFLSNGTAPWSHSSNEKHNSRRKPTKRVVSTPVAGMKHEPSGSSDHSDGSFAKRRNVGSPTSSPLTHSHHDSRDNNHPLRNSSHHHISNHALHFQSPPTSSHTPPVATPDIFPSSTGTASFVPLSKLNSQHSPTPSEIPSSHLGSDNDTNVFSLTDEDAVDLRSDTIYDSMRTGVTRNNSGSQGLQLEKMFNKTPGQDHQMSRGALSRIVQSTDSSLHQPDHCGNNLFEDEENDSSPVRTVIAEDDEGAHSRVSGLHVDASSLLLPRSLNLGTLPYDGEMHKPDSPWYDEAVEAGWDVPHSHPVRSKDQAGTNPSQALVSTGSESHRHAMYRPDVIPHEFDMKSSVFDWSEQPNDRGSLNTSPLRPKTVHGKKDTDARGSRSATRRTPSALHARSHSVPVLPDLIGKRHHTASKFGTWGVGSKGVTEDWNEDFDFGTGPDSEEKAIVEEQERLDSGIAMFVPESIREQQTNVLANIGLLREWGLLIEELKELRAKAVSLGLLINQATTVFDEVDAMIDLADQEAESDGLALHRSATSSPGMEFGDSGSSQRGTPRLRQATPEEDVSGHTHQRTHGSNTSPVVDARVSAMFASRPRKSSEAVARSVIEAIQQKRSPSDPVLVIANSKATKKVPFDTATLKHIVPYVNGLTRRMKEMLRQTEGLDTSPKHDTQELDPPFSQAFDEPDSPTVARARRAKRSNEQKSNKNSDEQVKGQDLVTQMKFMRVM